MLSGVIKAAAGDAIITFLWVFCVSTIEPLTYVIQNTLLQIDGVAATFLIVIALIFLLAFVFNLIGYVLGGASFNATGNVAFYAAGLGDDNLITLAVRFPAQAAGAVGGALAIVECMPQDYKHMLGGPSLKVDLHTGAAAEGLLTFVISLIVLWIIVKGPRNFFVKTLMLVAATVVLIVTGSRYTGPSMNPANAFGWAYINNRHDTWEQFYVYWIFPFVGAIFAGWIFRILFPLSAPETKVKEA